MSQVTNMIRTRRDDSRGALIGYLPVGFPDVATSIDAAEALVRGGVDIIEFGLPYSDPGMDGSVIQAATVEALKNGVKVADAFTAIEELTKRVDVPVVIMT